MRQFFSEALFIKQRSWIIIAHWCDMCAHKTHYKVQWSLQPHKTERDETEITAQRKLFYKVVTW